MPSYSAAVRDEKTHEAVELRAKQHSYRQIGERLGIHHATVKTWIENELSRRSEHRGIDKESHLAVYDAIQKASWEGFEQTPVGHPHRSGYLNTAKSCEDAKVKITGAEAPKKIQHVDEDFEIVFDDAEFDPAEAS